MTKFKPILFNTEMVQALLDGRKTQTRRTQGLDYINDRPDDWYLDGARLNGSFILHNKVTKEEFWVNPKYQEYETVLWVRETWAKSELFENVQSGGPLNTLIHYKASENQIDYPVKFKRSKWKPSIFMPKSACRLFVEVTNVRIERLKDISEGDARKEGVERLFPNFKSYNKNHPFCYTAYGSFKSLWQSINGADSWESNPWVWVIEFERIERPDGFLV